MEYSSQKGVPGHCFVAQVWDDGGNSIAEIGSTDNPEVANSRARLFAASPDLLAACKSARSLLHKMGGTNYDPEYTELCRAIAKAESP